MSTMGRRTPLTACGDTMDATDILEIIGMVNEMENISKVEITLGESPTIVVEKTPSAPGLSLGATNKTTTQAPKEASYPGFGMAAGYSPEPSNNLATEAQRKYADDLANKLGEGDMMNVVYGLAQALGEVADDILHPSLWKTQMTRDQADAYIDILEQEWNKVKKQRGGFQ